MKNEKNTCQGCYWEESCCSTEACSDYTPINEDDSNIAYYSTVLRENAQEYGDLVKEQNS